MASTRQDLLRLLASKSFRLGQFKLSSGGTSDYYIDCRTTTLTAKGARLTGQVLLDEIRNRGWKPKAVGGLTMGADPIVVAVSLASGEVDGFLVRKAEKQHGTGRRIEGFQEKGARVVIVDDVCTTGASTMQAIEAARSSAFRWWARCAWWNGRRREGVPAWSKPPPRRHLFPSSPPTKCGKSTCCKTTRPHQASPWQAPAAKSAASRRWCTTRESVAKCTKTKSSAVVGLKSSARPETSRSLKTDD